MLSDTAFVSSLFHGSHGSKIKISSDWGPREIVLGSAYLPYYGVEPPRGIGEAGNGVQGWSNSRDNRL
jgi:hypothetical protein